MKKLFSILILLFTLTTWAQAKKFEASHKETGKTYTIEEGQRVKVTTLDRKKFVGILSIKDSETLNVDNNEVKLSNLGTIKYYPRGGRTAKNVLYGVGSGLIVGSGVAAAAGNGNAFAMFMGGSGTAIIGALVNNKNKNLTYRHYIYKIVE